MPTRTPTQDKALKWYVEKFNLRMQLSTHPVYYFVDKETGEEKKDNIMNTLGDYKRERDEEKRSAKRNKR